MATNVVAALRLEGVLMRVSLSGPVSAELTCHFSVN
jgi:hypothetical protein